MARWRLELLRVGLKIRVSVPFAHALKLALIAASYVFHWETGVRPLPAHYLKKGSVSFIVVLPGGMGGRNGRENGFIQPGLAGLEAEQPEETELANCLVLSRPEYKDAGRKQEWSCSLHAQPSIFQPD